MTTTPYYLDCAHCGCEAKASDASGLFFESGSEPCMTCGWPGQVMVGEDEGTAYWRTDDSSSAKCNQPDCDYCGEHAAKEEK